MSRKTTEMKTVICFEPGIARREGSDSRFIEDRCVPLRAQMGDNQPAVCYAVDSHPADSRMEITGDIAPTITVKIAKGSADGPLVLVDKCYAIEGNVVDRTSSKNGKGWCEDISPTLNTQDKHAVVYALEGNGARPSHMGRGYHDDGTMYTLNTIETHSVCYEKQIECYAIENHPNDSRAKIDPDGIVQCLSSRMGTGGNNTPFVLIRRQNESISKDHRSTVCEQSSGELYGARCIQQHVARDTER